MFAVKLHTSFSGLLSGRGQPVDVARLHASSARRRSPTNEALSAARARSPMSLRLRSSIASRDDATRALRRLSAVRAVKDDERRRFSAALEALGLGGAATLSPGDLAAVVEALCGGPADADGLAYARREALRWHRGRAGAAIARPARSDADGRAPVAELALRGERAAPCDAAVAVAAAEPPGAGDGDDLPEGAAPRAVQRYRRYLAHAALLDDACARYGDGEGVVGRDALPKALRFLLLHLDHALRHLRRPHGGRGGVAGGRRRRGGCGVAERGARLSTRMPAEGAVRSSFFYCSFF